MFAAAAGHRKSVRILLQGGADVHATDLVRPFVPVCRVWVCVRASGWVPAVRALNGVLVPPPLGLVESPSHVASLLPSVQLKRTPEAIAAEKGNTDVVRDLRKFTSPPRKPSSRTVAAVRPPLAESVDHVGAAAAAAVAAATSDAGSFRSVGGRHATNASSSDILGSRRDVSAGAGVGAGAGASVVDSQQLGQGDASTWLGDASVLTSVSDSVGEPGDEATAELRRWLRSIRLEKKCLRPLQELGAETMEDIQNLEYEDLDELGLRKLEKRRFWKAVQALAPR